VNHENYNYLSIITTVLWVGEWTKWMCVEDRQDWRELWLILDRCAGDDSLERQSKGLQLNRVNIRAVLNRPCQKVPCHLRSWIQIAYICRSLRFRHGAWCRASSLRRQIDRLSQAWGEYYGVSGCDVLWSCDSLAAGGVIISWGAPVSMMQCPSTNTHTGTGTYFADLGGMTGSVDPLVY